MSDTPSSSVIIINKSEFDFLKDDEQITQVDIVEMIEHRECFDKFIRKAIRKIRIDIANFKYVEREKEAYNQINGLSELSKSMWSTINNYKEYIDKLEESKE